VNPRHAVLEGQELDVAAVRLHVRAHRIERILDSPRERDRVQVVDQQQRRDQLVLGERGRDVLAVCAGVHQCPDDSLQAGAVHLHDRRHELLGQRARGRVTAQLEPSLELLNAIDELLAPGGRVHPATPGPSECA